MTGVTTIPNSGVSRLICPELAPLPRTADNNQRCKAEKAALNGQKRKPSYSQSLPRSFTGNRWYGIRHSGRLIELQTRYDSEYVGMSGGGVRGQVSEFSWSSRRRLLKTIGSIPWAVVGEKWFVTLTYPAEFPTDGRVAKRHLDSFRKAFERAYCKTAVAVWKMEFQNRGAPHFHVLMPRPRLALSSWSSSGEDLFDFRVWCAETWFRIVGSGDDRHLLAGTGVEVSTSDCARYFAYMLKEKVDQNRVPEGYTNPGRFWGVWGGRPEFKGVLLSREEFLTLNRAMRKWERASQWVAVDGHLVMSPLRSFCNRKKTRRADASNWFLSPPGSGPLIYKFLRLLDREVVSLLT